MRAPLSVVIPTLNAAPALPQTLGSLTEGLEAGLIRELLITDGGSEDETRQIAEAAGADWITGEASRGGQLRRGAAATEGAWLLILHADTHLAPGWAEAVLSHLRDHADKAGYFALAFRATGLAPRLVAGWANWRARRLGLPYGDQGLLIPRTLYNEVGGYSDIPLMEDVALARALRGRMVPLSATALTSAERYQREGWINRGARNLINLTRFLLGADPVALARRYRSN
jgi:rSAM/selenodomain-associated transferase 2